MDAAGARMVNQGATKGASELDSSSAQSRSSPTANPDEHEKDLQDGDDNTAASDDLEEEEDAEEQEEEEDSDEDDEEPRLKYAYLTKHLGSVYRNGDATSTFLVAGDKMVSPVIELGGSVS